MNEGVAALMKVGWASRAPDGGRLHAEQLRLVRAPVRRKGGELRAITADLQTVHARLGLRQRVQVRVQL